MESGESKLVVIRGPSASGKTTVAKRLFELAADNTVLIEQDYYRFIFKPPGHGINSRAIHRMIQYNVLTALEHGCDVILEGILIMKSYSEVFKQLFREHAMNNYMFHFDISFDETLRRHGTRNASSGFGPEEMKSWYPGSGPAGYEFEQVIPVEFSVEQTVEAIRKATGI